MSEWINCPLKEIVSFGNGKARPKSEGDIPVYGGNGILGHSSESNYQDETIIIGRVGAYCGSTYYEDRPIWVSDNALSAKAKAGFFPKYVFYVLKAKNLNQYAQGSSHPLLTQGLLNTIEAYVTTDPATQVSIAHIITTLEEKIENNRQMNETLEGMAQAIFKSWFVDFDPVKVKIAVLESGGSAEDALIAAMQAISGLSAEDLDTLRTQNEAAYAELKSTAEAFPSAFTESPLGPIPEGWEVKKIEDVAKTIKGKSYKSSELAESKTALVTLKSFNRGGGYRLDGLKEYTGTYKPDQEVFAGDLIIAYTDVTQAADVIGKPAMVISDSRYDHLVISLDVAVVRPDRDSLKYYLYGLAQTEQFQQHTNAHSAGTTVLHLSKSAVPEYQFALPGNTLIKAYERTAKPIFILINESIEENQSLAETRDALLPKLLSGEIDVSALSKVRDGADA